MVEKLGRIEKLDDGRAILHYPGFEPRIYATLSAAATRQSRLKRGRATHRYVCPPWTKGEDATLRRIWGTLTKVQYEASLPGRTYSAIKTRARHLEIKADPVCWERARARTVEATRARSRALWTEDQLRIVAENKENIAIELLKGQKRPEQVMSVLAHSADEALLGSKWNEAEISLIRSINRSFQTLHEKHGRTHRAICGQRYRVQIADAKMAEAVGAVRDATRHLPADIRDEVGSETLIALLALEVNFSDLGAAVKRAVTRIYGRRHYSLDAPRRNGDGGTWMDTIASDREHF